MFSTAPGHEQLGYSSQHELMFSIPVVFTNLFGIPLAVGMFVPHICVDEAFSMITGREVVGFCFTPQEHRLLRPAAANRPTVRSAYHEPGPFQCEAAALLREPFSDFTARDTAFRELFEYMKSEMRGAISDLKREPLKTP